MQLILIEDVDGLGITGDTVKVKPGYARNFLLPRSLAVEANARNARQLEHHQQMVAARVAKKQAEAEGLAGQIRKTEVQIPVLVGEEDRLFGSVTNRDIEQALAEAGIAIDRKKIALAEPIKALGVHTVAVKVHPTVTAELKVWVVKKEGAATPAPETAAKADATAPD